MGYPFTVKKSQTWDVSGLYLLTASKNLASKLQLFLVYCRVDNLSEATIHDYQFKIWRFVQFCQKANVEKISDVTPSVINLFFLDLKQRQKPSSTLGYHKSIKRFFNWLVEQDCLEKNPMEKIKSPKVFEAIVQPFTTEQIKRMLAVCNERHLLGLRKEILLQKVADPVTAPVDRKGALKELERLGEPIQLPLVVSEEDEE